MELIASVIGGAIALCGALLVFIWAQWSDTERRQYQQLAHACDRILEEIQASGSMALLITTAAKMCSEDLSRIECQAFQRDIDEFMRIFRCGHPNRSHQIAFAHGLDDLAQLLALYRESISIVTSIATKITSDCTDLWTTERNILGPDRSKTRDRFQVEQQHILKWAELMSEWREHHIILHAYARTETRVIQRRCTERIEVSFWDRLRLRLTDQGMPTSLHGGDKSIDTTIEAVSRGLTDNYSEQLNFYSELQ